MTKYIKSLILLLVVLPMMIMGCDTLFDKGDVEKSYDGPTQVAFFPLERQTRVVQGGTTVDVQLIGPHRSTALEVNVLNLPFGAGLNVTQLSDDLGTGYTTNENVQTTGGTGNNLTVDITVDESNGEISSVRVNNPGVGYTVGDILTISGGNNNARIRISSIVTSVEGTHYNFSSNNNLIDANSSTVTLDVNFIAGSLPAGGEVVIVLDITGTNDSSVELAENLKRSTIFLRP